MKHGQGWRQGEAISFCLIMIANEMMDGLWPSEKKTVVWGGNFLKESAAVKSTIAEVVFFGKTVNGFAEKVNVRIVSFKH